MSNERMGMDDVWVMRAGGDYQHFKTKTLKT